MVIYLAGLQGVPQQLYEAAEIDGANYWHRFRHVTIPMMSPVIFFNLLLGLIGALQTFTQALHHHQRRPAERDAVLRAVPLSPGLHRLQDGLCRGAGLGTLRDRPGVVDPRVPHLGRQVYYEDEEPLVTAQEGSADVRER